MPQFPETTTSVIELAAGTTPGSAVGRVALIAAPDAADTIAPAVVRVYSSAALAATERGVNSKLAIGVKHVLAEGHGSVVTVAADPANATQRNAAFDALGEENFEYIAPAGTVFEAGALNVTRDYIQNILAFANANKKMVAMALPSAADPVVSSTFVTSIRDGRLSLFAAKAYTGDATSAYVGMRSKYDIHSQIKLQPTPRSLAITKGYTFTEYGGHKTPATDTWHALGVNAAFKYRGGYFMSASRSATGATAKDRWDYFMRIVNDIDVELTTTLNNTVAANPSTNPVSQAGLDLAESNLGFKLRRRLELGHITAFALGVPSEANITQEQRDNAEMPEIQVSIKPVRQAGFYSLRIRAE